MDRSLRIPIALAALLACSAPARLALAHPPQHLVIERPAETPSIKLKGMVFEEALNYDDGLFEDLSDFLFSSVTIEGAPHGTEPDFHARFFQIDMSEVGAINDASPDGVTGTIARAGFGPRRTVDFEFKNPIEIYRHDQCAPCMPFTISMQIDEVDSVSASDIAEAVGKLPVLGDVVGLVPGKLLDKLIGDVVSSRTPAYRFELSFQCSLKDLDTPFYGAASVPPFFESGDPITRLERKDYKDENGAPGMGNLTLKLNVDLDVAAAGTAADGACPAGQPPPPPPDPSGDADMDGHQNGVDKCPDTPSPGNGDLDGDGRGDACDADTDGDGFTDDSEDVPFAPSDPFSAASTPENEIASPGSCLNALDDDQDGLVDYNPADPNDPTNDPGCDTDRDRVPDRFDVCVAVPDPAQSDADLDGIGDACEDEDDDLQPDGTDNCAGIDNTSQLDLDGDALGDACDQDRDGDLVPNFADTCPSFPNPVQTDLDADGFGDLCDNCALVANPGQHDTGGFALFIPDGTGTDCQCAEVSGDGNVSVLDATWMARAVAGLGPALPAAQRCSLFAGGGPCDAANLLSVRRALAGSLELGPGGCLGS